jgi:class 3 adenylate cyclase
VTKLQIGFLLLSISHLVLHVTLVRDPYQVFTLLETVYSKFDEAAERRRIFKVETVGDCYVAGKHDIKQNRSFQTTTQSLLNQSSLFIASGLPEPRKDHAVVMARFAKEILSDMAIVVAELETQLGPGTAALTIRIGVSYHSNRSIVPFH